MKKPRMKTIGAILRLLTALILAGALLPQAALAADTYKADPQHSFITFRIKHLGIAFVYGRFTGFTGEIIFDAANPEKSSVFMQAQAQSVDTGVNKRDTHLKSPDFFNTEKYQSIVFKSHTVKPLGPGLFEVSGDLTLMGVTRPLTFRAAKIGQGKDPWGGYRMGFEARFKIRRSDFNMGFMIPAVADKVQVTVSIEGVKQ